MAQSENDDVKKILDELREHGSSDTKPSLAPDPFGDTPANGADTVENIMSDNHDLVDAVDAVQQELEQLRAERDDMRDRFMRALADAENARKRSEKDRREAQQYGGSRLARDILPVFDNLQRALQAVTDDQREQAAALIEGVELTQKELLKALTSHGVSALTPEVGDKFDPQHHEAMFEAPVPGTKAGEIIQVMADGFMLHDRLLRPAQVGVSSSPE